MYGSQITTKSVIIIIFNNSMNSWFLWICGKVCGYSVDKNGGKNRGKNARQNHLKNKTFLSSDFLPSSYNTPSYIFDPLDIR